MWSILVFMMMITSGVASHSESKVVTIDQGRLRGFRYSDSNFFTFMSVPYATAPPGEQRFRAPLPAPVWMETFDAVETGQVCPQGKRLPNIRENCLIANIFVPDTNATNLPVMVYVHGGAYVVFYGDYTRYTKLVDVSKAVIAVTFNYRLGVHGFLCLGTKDVPGNAGMKDQVALLRWVQRNIANFGGNPDNVTLIGCNAGATAIDLLTLSPMATGLFHNAVIEGGSSLILNGVQLDPIKNAKIYAKALNFSDVENITALEEFYKTASYELLFSQVDQIVDRDDSTSLFSPCVEKDTGTEEIFLPKTPWKILDQGNYTKIPLLYGFSEMEGLVNIHTFEYRKDKMNEKFANYLPGDLEFDSNEEKEKVGELVKKFYFGEQDISKETIIGYINYYTDILIAFPILRSLRMRQRAGNETVYLFEYSFVDENIYVPDTNVKGASFCSFIHAVMDEEFRDKTEEYRAIKKTMRDILLNFVITGKPVPEGSSLPAWPPVDINKWSPHMAFNNATPVLKESLSLEARANFWNKIYEKYFRIHIPPPTNDAMSHRICVINIICLCIFYGYIVK